MFHKLLNPVANSGIIYAGNGYKGREEGGW